MNQHSLLVHYNIIKTLKEISHAIYLSNSNQFPFRMKWDLLENETESYALFSTKKSALQLSRINKVKGAGYPMAKFEVANANTAIDSNGIYRGGTGFTIHNSKPFLNYLEPGNKTPEVLEPLPMDTMSSLLFNEGLEELEFQYGTVLNFVGTSFEMYCLFSLLHNVDEIGTPIANNTFNRVSFLDIIDDSVEDELLSSLVQLKDKIILDLSHA